MVVVIVDMDGRLWNILARRVSLNRDNAGQNSVAREAKKILDIELDNTLYFGEKNTISWGAGVRNEKTEQSGDDSVISGRLFVQLVHEF